MEDQYIVPTVVSRGEVMFTALGDRDDTEMVAMANTCVKGCDHGDRLTDRPDHRDCRSPGLSPRAIRGTGCPITRGIPYKQCLSLALAT